MELSVHPTSQQSDDMGRRIVAARRAAHVGPSRMRHPMLGLALVVIADLGCVGLIHHLFY